MGLLGDCFWRYKDNIFFSVLSLESLGPWRSFACLHYLFILISETKEPSFLGPSVFIYIHHIFNFQQITVTGISSLLKRKQTLTVDIAMKRRDAAKKRLPDLLNQLPKVKRIYKTKETISRQYLFYRLWGLIGASLILDLLRHFVPLPFLTPWVYRDWVKRLIPAKHLILWKEKRKEIPEDIKRQGLFMRAPYEQIWITGMISKGNL